LRAFRSIDGIAYQIPRPAGESRLSICIRDTTDDTLAAELQHALQHVFDLSSGLTLHAELLRFGPEAHVLVLIIHHISADGWSLPLLARDIAQAYAARCSGLTPQWPALPIDYTDYVLWKQEQLGSEADPDSITSARLAYWRKTLDALPEEMNLPIDRKRRTRMTGQGKRLGFSIQADTLSGLQKLSRDCDATLYMVLHAGVSALLSLGGAGSDIVIGASVAGRIDDALKDMVGLIADVVVLRLDTSGEPSFRDLILRARAIALSAYANQDLPFESIVNALAPTRSFARQPLFQVMLDFENIATDVLHIPGLAVRSLQAAPEKAKFDLSFSFAHAPQAEAAESGLIGFIEYACDLFDEETIAHMVEGLIALFDIVVHEPELHLQQIAESRALAAHLSALNARSQPLREPRTAYERVLYDLFSQTLDCAPGDLRDSFFALGGNEQQAAQLIERLQAVLGLKLDMAMLRQASSIAALSALIEGQTRNKPQLRPLRRPAINPL
jgi:pristinamycin I synthase 3 and 4